MKVHNHGLGVVVNRKFEFSEPATELDVFVVKEEALIQTTNLINSGSRNQKRNSFCNLENSI
ncbi:MAG: hypothetical protein UU94_C0020G0010 [Candidatus Collierbacteria bacterium GW2011_GWB2_42_12]|nr:MAG: hypothetical protein UU94_C0020G0010 [Candidatus Collierbacteria bacterium GW2011_GWB2_42_12]